jgi:hypothetical protein
VIVTMPPPSFLHGICCNQIGYQLRKHVRGQNLSEHDTLSGADVLPGFACTVAELFP